MINLEPVETQLQPLDSEIQRCVEKYYGKPALAYMDEDLDEESCDCFCHDESINILNSTCDRECCDDR